MRATVPAGPVLAAFGDLDADIWGVALGGPEPRLAVGSLSDGAPVALRPARTAEPGAEWTLSAGADSVTIAPAAEAGALTLTHVTGRFERAGGDSAELSLGGVRCELHADGRLASVRLVAAWFGSERGVALSAYRPQGAGGQDRDRIEVALNGESEGLSVFDPHLSTTYDADGVPRRMGVELWLGETEEGDQFPRRVAGEASGSHASGASAAGMRVGAHALRCHSRGETGAGVYLLLQAAG
jgi:hypothetical protein